MKGREEQSSLGEEASVSMVGQLVSANVIDRQCANIGGRSIFCSWYPTSANRDRDICLLLQIGFLIGSNLQLMEYQDCTLLGTFANIDPKVCCLHIFLAIRQTFWQSTKMSAITKFVSLSDCASVTSDDLSLSIFITLLTCRQKQRLEWRLNNR